MSAVQAGAKAKAAQCLEAIGLEFVEATDEHSMRMMALYRGEADRRWVDAITALLIWSRS